MTDQRLYIDGELVDLGEDTKFTLSIKSNLFREISDIVSNNSYTIKLPKTVRNQRILGHSDLVQNGGSTFPYRYHTAQYFRNGVQLIRNGRAAVMSIGEDFEISIVWGLYPAFSELVNEDMSIQDIESDASILWPSSVTIDTYDNFIQRGYGYADYVPFFSIANEDEWSSINYTLGLLVANRYNLNEGEAIPTGTETGVVISVTPEKEYTDYRSAVRRFLPGSSMRIEGIVGGTDIRAYAILDQNYKVLELAPPAETDDDGNITGEPETLTVRSTVTSAWIVVNAYAPKSTALTFTVTEMITDIRRPTLRLNNNYIQPCVTMAWILSRIKELKGVTFQWPDAEQQYIDTLALPLISNNGSKYARGTNTEALFLELGNNDVITFHMEEVDNELFDVEQYATSNRLVAIGSRALFVQVEINYRWDASDTNPSGWQSTGNGGRVNFYNYYGNYAVMRIIHPTEDDEEEDVDEYVIGTSGEMSFLKNLETNMQGGYFYHKIIGYGNIDIVEGDIIEFVMRNEVSILDGTDITTGSLTMSTVTSDEVVKGAYFPIAANLPDISVTDIVKFLCAVTGTFPLQIQDESLVQFVTIDTIWDNISTPVDWTDKLIDSTCENKPKELEFKIGDYAQNNWYRWKIDERAYEDNDGSFKIDNKTLEDTKDIYEFPFASSDDNIVPIFDITLKRTNDMETTRYEETEEYDRNIEPRIMHVYSKGNTAALRFDMDMQEIIDTKYKNLAATLNAAKVIKETFTLSDIDIMEFDETRPVYLAQYGAYFAVTEIQVNEDGTSDVTMFQLVKVD